MSDRYSDLVDLLREAGYLPDSPLHRLCRAIRRLLRRQ